MDGSAVSLSDAPSLIGMAPVLTLEMRFVTVVVITFVGIALVVAVAGKSALPALHM